MIVCVCNNVSDKQIRHAAANGATCVKDLRATLDVGSCCGKCTGCAKKILREVQNDAAHFSVPMFIQNLHFPAPGKAGALAG